jgi:hypothetical protein
MRSTKRRLADTQQNLLQCAGLCQRVITAGVLVDRSAPIIGLRTNRLSLGETFARAKAVATSLHGQRSLESLELCNTNDRVQNMGGQAEALPLSLVVAKLIEYTLLTRDRTAVIVLRDTVDTVVVVYADTARVLWAALLGTAPAVVNFGALAQSIWKVATYLSEQLSGTFEALLFAEAVSHSWGGNNIYPVTWVNGAGPDAMYVDGFEIQNYERSLPHLEGEAEMQRLRSENGDKPDTVSLIDGLAKRVGHKPFVDPAGKVNAGWIYHQALTAIHELTRRAHKDVALMPYIDGISGTDAADAALNAASGGHATMTMDYKQNMETWVEATLPQDKYYKQSVVAVHGVILHVGGKTHKFVTWSKDTHKSTSWLASAMTQIMREHRHLFVGIDHLHMYVTLLGFKLFLKSCLNPVIFK